MTGLKSIRRVKFGDYVADLDSFELRKHGIRLKLQDQPFQILELLLERPGQLVTREQLRTTLWTESTFVDFDAGLNAAIRRLRDTLNDSPDEPRYIETLPRHGYRFIGEVKELPDESRSTPPEASAISGVDPAPKSDQNATGPQKSAASLGPSRNLRIFASSIAIAALLLLGLALKSESARRRLFVSHAANQVQSIAVLPFENLSSNSSEQYFADAMTDALITNLSQVGSLKVTSRTSVMQFRGSRPSLPQIAGELHVDSVVEGTIVRDGNRVRITAQLIDANSDHHLWAKRYDRDLTDILSIQADVATQIASEIRANLTPQERDRLSQTRPVNSDAYEAYLRARYFFQREDADEQKKAKEYYLKSISLDPSFAPSYTGLAENFAYLAFMGSFSRDDWLAAEKLVKKSLELDPNSAPAHTVFGLIRWQYYCDPAGAEREFATALQLSPGDMFTRDYYSYYLLQTGRREEAIVQKQQVLSHDPVSVRTNAELGLYYLEAQRYEDAIRQLQQTLELEPNNFRAIMRLGLAYQGKQQYDQAIIQMKKAIEIDNVPAKQEHLGDVYAQAGMREEALKMIEVLKERRHECETAVGIALIYLHLGERELALSWLEQAKPGDGISLSDSGFDGLRSDPRFKAIEARMKTKEEEACPPK